MSSSRSALLPYYVLEETGVAASKLSKQTNISAVDVVQYDVIWANGSVDFDATIQVEVLSSYEGTTVESEWVWTVLSFGGTSPQMTGTSGSHNIILTANPFEKIRARVVHSAGTGDVKISIKGNGN